MRKTSCEWRSIIERELWLAFGELQTGLERVYLSPELDDFLFLLREVKLGANWTENQVNLIPFVEQNLICSLSCAGKDMMLEDPKQVNYYY
jgi:hypothetical protein